MASIYIQLFLEKDENGIIALVASLAVFLLYRSPNEKTIAEVWEQTRKRMNEEANSEEEQKPE